MSRPERKARKELPSNSIQYPSRRDLEKTNRFTHTHRQNVKINRITNAETVTCKSHVDRHMAQFLNLPSAGNIQIKQRPKPVESG